MITILIFIRFKKLRGLKIKIVKIRYGKACEQLTKIMFSTILLYVYRIYEIILYYVKYQKLNENISDLQNTILKFTRYFSNINHTMKQDIEQPPKFIIH